jgi:hypothetical protein
MRWPAPVHRSREKSADPQHAAPVLLQPVEYVEEIVRTFKTSAGPCPDEKCIAIDARFINWIDPLSALFGGTLECDKERNRALLSKQIDHVAKGPKLCAFV